MQYPSYVPQGAHGRGRKHQTLSQWDARAPRCCPTTRFSCVPTQHSPEPSSFPLLGLAGPPVGTGVGGAATECHLAVPALGRGRGGSEKGATAPCPAPPALSHSAGHCGEQRGGTVLQAASPGGTAEPPHCLLPLCIDGSPGGGARTRVPCSHWGRCSGRSQGGRCGRCPGSGRGWRGRGCTWPGRSGRVGLRDGRRRDDHQCGERWGGVRLWAPTWGAEPQPRLGTEHALPRGCTPGNGTASVLLRHQGCATSQARGQKHPGPLLHKAPQQTKCWSLPDSRSIVLPGAGQQAARLPAVPAALPEDSADGQMDGAAFSHLGTQTSWRGWSAAACLPCQGAQHSGRCLAPCTPS